MHELAVTENILEITLRHARQAEARRVAGIYLVIGQLATIVDDSVQFYWDIISKDTIAESAQLHFRRLPVKLLCLDCDHQFSPADEDYACPNCRSERIKVIAGEEFFIESIEVE